MCSLFLTLGLAFHGTEALFYSMNVLCFYSMYVSLAPLDVVMGILQATSPIPRELGIIKQLE